MSAVISARAVSAASTAYGAYASNKAAKAAGKVKLIDIPKVVEDARLQARTNIADSIALEQEFDPTTAAARRASDAGLLNELTGPQDAMRAERDRILAGAEGDTSRRDSLLDGLINAATNEDPLTTESSQRILADLRLGGALDAETQALVTKSALEGGAMSGVLGSNAGRGIVARDLGLTSMGLARDRQDRAFGVGTTLDGARFGRTNAALGATEAALSQDLDRKTGLATTLGNVSNADFGRTFNIAQLLASRARPVSGLDPAAVAELEIANTGSANQARANAAAIKAQGTNALIQGIGQLAGTGASVYGTYAKQNPSAGAIEMAKIKAGRG